MMAQALQSNVVALPTAAKRRVANPAGFVLIAASKELPQHPAQWEDHGGSRKAWEEVRFDRSPEMMVCTALMQVLTDEQKQRVRTYIGALPGGPHATTAFEIVERIK